MADTAEHPDVAVPQERGYGWRSRLLGDYGIMIVVVAMGVVLTILQPEYFLSAQNLTNIIRQIGMNALLALGLYLVILDRRHRSVGRLGDGVVDHAAGACGHSRACLGRWSC